MDDLIKKIRFGSNERIRNMHLLFGTERTKNKNLTQENERLKSEIKSRDDIIQKHIEDFNKLTEGNYIL